MDERLDLEELQLSSFVTTLDESQQAAIEGGAEAAWSSRWYHSCVTPTSDGTGFCDSTFSFDSCTVKEAQ